MSKNAPEPWLRGPVAGIPAPLQPVAHALQGADESLESAVSGLSSEQLWNRPGGAASIGFHLVHLAGSTDRLFTYARGEALDPARVEALARERRADEERPALDEMLRGWKEVLEAALRQLGETPETTLPEPRFVGRAKLPSTVQGLLFHAAEHAARHTGQIVTTARIVRSEPAV